MPMTGAQPYINLQSQFIYWSTTKTLNIALDMYGKAPGQIDGRTIQFNKKFK